MENFIRYDTEKNAELDTPLSLNYSLCLHWAIIRQLLCLVLLSKFLFFSLFEIIYLLCRLMEQSFLISIYISPIHYVISILLSIKIVVFPSGFFTSKFTKLVLPCPS